MIFRMSSRGFASCTSYILTIIALHTLSLNVLVQNIMVANIRSADKIYTIHTLYVVPY